MKTQRVIEQIASTQEILVNHKIYAVMMKRNGKM